MSKHVLFAAISGEDFDPFMSTLLQASPDDTSVPPRFREVLRQDGLVAWEAPIASELTNRGFVVKRSTVQPDEAEFVTRARRDRDNNPVLTKAGGPVWLALCDKQRTDNQLVQGPACGISAPLDSKGQPMLDLVRVVDPAVDGLTPEQVRLIQPALAYVPKESIESVSVYTSTSSISEVSPELLARAREALVVRARLNSSYERIKAFYDASGVVPNRSVEVWHTRVSALLAKTAQPAKVVAEEFAKSSGGSANLRALAAAQRGDAVFGWVKEAATVVVALTVVGCIVYLAKMLSSLQSAFEETMQACLETVREAEQVLSNEKSSTEAKRAAEDFLVHARGPGGCLSRKSPADALSGALKSVGWILGLGVGAYALSLVAPAIRSSSGYVAERIDASTRARRQLVGRRSRTEF